MRKGSLILRLGMVGAVALASCTPTAEGRRRITYTGARATDHILAGIFDPKVAHSRMQSSGTWVNFFNLDSGNREFFLPVGTKGVKPEIKNYLASKFYSGNFPNSGYLLVRVENGKIIASEKALLNPDGTRVIFVQ